MSEPVVEEGVLIFPEDCYETEPSQFANWSEIESIRWPSHPVRLANETFYGCTGLTEVTLPEGTERLPMGLFAACIALSSVTFPAGLREIGDSAFMFCAALGQVAVPEGVTRIGKNAFFGSGLRSVTLPGSLQMLDERALANCASLRHIEALNDQMELGPSAIFPDPPDPEAEAMDFLALLGLSSDCNLCEGYLKAGMPERDEDPRLEYYAELWATCPERHDGQTSARMKGYIANHGTTFMETVIRHGNVVAVRTLTGLGVLDRNGLDEWIRLSTEEGTAELTAVLLSYRGAGQNEEAYREEFTL